MNTNPPFNEPATTPIELDVQDIQNFVLNPVAFPFARYAFFSTGRPLSGLSRASLGVDGPSDRLAAGGKV